MTSRPDAEPAPVREASSSEDTLRQTPDAAIRSRELSRLRERPPGKIPGYEIRRLLGEGAYGSVWLAVETKTGKQVAIKFYTHRRGLDWSLLCREVEKLAVLYTSRNVVGLLDVGWDHDPPYFVMEYLERGPLSTQLAAGPLPEKDALRITRSVLEALVHAHNSGILHCDLKPANVLLDSGGAPRLGDFGQSRLSTEQSPALGTLYYMAPEQAVLDGVPDARWDVYALGALLYHMLTGTPPYRTPENEARLQKAATLEERLKTYRQIIAGSPRPEGHRRRGVDSRLSEIIDHCLERDPHLRHPNAQVVLDLLDARERARAKRPLVLLGVLGPLVLLTALGWIAWNAIPLAVATAEQGLFQRALDSDAVAAKILAASVDQEFDVRLKELEDMARTLAETSPDGTPRLRTDLDAHLDDWKKQLNDRLSEHRRTTDESIFVNDFSGVQVYRYPRDQTIGKNFRFRDYFHGLGRELAEGDDLSYVVPRNKAGVSLAYRSRSTGQYRVAVAVPIWAPDDSRVLGVLARTINLSDLLNQWEAGIRMPHHGDGEDAPRFLALADLREPEAYLLDHPWLSEQDAERLSDAELRAKLQIPGAQQRLLRTTDRSPDYADPIAALDPRFQGPWLAAFAPVGDTGWVAIVQERRAAAVLPVDALRSVFMRYGGWALLAFMGVSLMLGLLLQRASR